MQRPFHMLEKKAKVYSREVVASLSPICNRAYFMFGSSNLCVHNSIGIKSNAMATKLNEMPIALDGS